MSTSTGAVHARELTSSGVWKLIQVTPSVQGGVVKLPLLRSTWFRRSSILGPCAGMQRLQGVDSQQADSPGRECQTGVACLGSGAAGFGQRAHEYVT